MSSPTSGRRRRRAGTFCRQPSSLLLLLDRPHPRLLVPAGLSRHPRRRGDKGDASSLSPPHLPLHPSSSLPLSLHPLPQILSSLIPLARAARARPSSCRRRCRGPRAPRTARRCPEEPPWSTSSIPSINSSGAALYTRHRHHLHFVHRRRPPSIPATPVHLRPPRPRLRAHCELLP